MVPTPFSRDAREGYATGADLLAEGGHSEAATLFRGFSEQRGAFYDELSELAASYGDDVDASGSVAGNVHRAWMSVKASLTAPGPVACSSFRYSLAIFCIVV